MTTETITWSGEEWEVIHSSINLGTLKEYANVTLRRKPKPLRELWVVYRRCGGLKESRYFCDTKQRAEEYVESNSYKGEHTIVYMREVWDE